EVPRALLRGSEILFKSSHQNDLFVAMFMPGSSDVLTILFRAAAIRTQTKPRLTTVCLIVKKVGSNLGPTAPKLGPKPCTMTQNKARRTNKIDFLQLPWAQEVRGSNPRAPTNPINELAASGVTALAPL